jgi:hypothetical protein
VTLLRWRHINPPWSGIQYTLTDIRTIPVTINHTLGVTGYEYQIEKVKCVLVKATVPSNCTNKKMTEKGNYRYVLVQKN